MIAPRPKPARSPWRNGYGLAGAALAAFLIYYFGWEAIYAAASRARPLPLLFMTLLIIAGFWLRAWKWRYALGPGQHGAALFFIAKMAGNWTPGRAGEFSPLLLPKHRSASVAAWILADRLLEIYLTLVFGVAGLAAVDLLSPRAAAAAAITLLAAAGAAAAALFWRYPAQGPAEAPSWAQKIRAALRTLHHEFRSLGFKSPLIFAITLLAKITDIFAVIVLCRAFDYSASFLLVCAARCAHALVSAIPLTPDATGVPYAAAAYVLHESAAIPYPVLTIALGIEVAIINGVLWSSFLAGAASLYAGRNPDSPQQDTP